MPNGHDQALYEYPREVAALKAAIRILRRTLRRCTEGDDIPAVVRFAAQRALDDARKAANRWLDDDA